MVGVHIGRHKMLIEDVRNDAREHGSHINGHDVSFAKRWHTEALYREHQSAAAEWIA